MTIVTPEPTIERDRFKRPLVKPAEGGKPVAYSRCTTFIDVISDKFNLNQWDKRMVALGLAQRPDLLLSVSAHKDDKGALNRICDDAKEAAKASAAATTGTALHALTELIDRGQDLPVLPESALADIEAYRAATAPLKHIYIEQFMVQDPLKIGGTPDRVVEYQGKRYIADLKTGSIEWDTGKIAAQLAVYARSQVYDVATGQRSRHDADIDRAIVIHLPAGEANCRLFWIDIKAGWSDVVLARNVREARKKKFRDLCSPFGADLLTVLEESVAAQPLEAQIRACTDADAVRALWAAHEGEWTDDLTATAKDHITTLAQAS